jgi:hypothetical protein
MNRAFGMSLVLDDICANPSTILTTTSKEESSMKPLQGNALEILNRGYFESTLTLTQKANTLLPLAILAVVGFSKLE